MKHLLALGGLLLAVAGCNGYPFTRPYAVYNGTSPDTLRGECERAAYDDQDVKDTLAKAAGTVSAYDIWYRQVERAKYAAVQRCMLQRGGPKAGGGVELPVR